jgi:hypothetical protein
MNQNHGVLAMSHGKAIRVLAKCWELGYQRHAIETLPYWAEIANQTMTLRPRFLLPPHHLIRAALHHLTNEGASE